MCVVAGQNVYLGPTIQLIRPEFCFESQRSYLTHVVYCRGHLLGQSFESSDRGRGPLQDEDHSGSRPHSFPGLYLMRSGRDPEWFWSGPVVADSIRKPSRRANAPRIRFSVLLKSFENLFVTLPTIFSET